MDLTSLFDKIFLNFAVSGISDVILSGEGIFVFYNQDLNKFEVTNYSFGVLLKEIVDRISIYKKYDIKDSTKDAIKEALYNRSSFNAAFSMEEKDLRIIVHIFLSRNEPVCILRIIHFADKDFKKLGFSMKHINPLLQRRGGLILISGPTGAGKSTTAAAIIEHHNKNYNWHIITVEDPIEYLFANAKSKISQREIAIDTPNYAEALRDVLRERPNLVFVGEIVSKQVAELALQAATAGQLVLSTIHASSIIETLDRLIGLYEMEHIHNVRLKIAYSLIGVLSQRLVKVKENGNIKLTLLYESLTNTNQSMQIILSTNQKLTLLYDVLKRQQVKLITEQLDDLINNDLLA